MKLKKILISLCAILLIISVTVTAVIIARNKDGGDDGEESITPQAKGVEVFIAKDVDEMPPEVSDSWKKPTHASILQNVSFEAGSSYTSYLKIINNASSPADFNITFKTVSDLNALAEVVQVYVQRIEVNLSLPYSAYRVGSLSEIIENRATVTSGTVHQSDPQFFAVTFIIEGEIPLEYLKYNKLGANVYIEYDYQFHVPETSAPSISLEQTHPPITEPPYVDTEPPIEMPPEEYHPEDYISRKNYNDNFTLSVQLSTNPIKYFNAYVNSSNALDQAVYERYEYIRDYLGVNVIFDTAGTHDTYVQSFINSVENKDGSYDALITHPAEGVSELVSGMYLSDISELPGVSMDPNYWNLEIMDTLNVSGSYYLGYNNINIPNTHVLTFSKQLLSELSAYVTEYDLYKAVYSGQWTLDGFISLCEFTSRELADHDPMYPTYALAGQQWVPWIGFLQASGLNYVEFDESAGAYQLSLMNDGVKDKTEAVIKSMRKLSASGICDLTYPVNGSIGYPYASVVFGDALMELVATKDISGYTHDYDIGILPYPLYDGDQYDPTSVGLGYRSLQWGGYIAVPAYLENAQMVGETLEMLSYASNSVLTAAFEDMLGKPMHEANDDATTLSIVWVSLCADAGQAYSDGLSILYYFPEVTYTGEGGYTSYSDRYNSIERAANKKLLSFWKKVQNYS